MNTQEAEKWLKDNGFSNACIRIDEYHRPDLYVSDVLIKYAQQQVKNLNIPAVSNRREQLIAFAQWLAHEEEYGKDGTIGTVDAYLESN